MSSVVLSLQRTAVLERVVGAVEVWHLERLHEVANAHKLVPVSVTTDELQLGLVEAKVHVLQFVADVLKGDVSLARLVALPELEVEPQISALDLVSYVAEHTDVRRPVHRLSSFHDRCSSRSERNRFCFDSPWVVDIGNLLVKFAVVDVSVSIGINICEKNLQLSIGKFDVCVRHHRLKLFQFNSAASINVLLGESLALFLNCGGDSPSQGAKCVQSIPSFINGHRLIIDRKML
mmetsp:Transcript_27122/g.62513  ORF Transcript_27122/g.62513 Transcript_27122/m.62513 type:complete len:234 (+) Transcript_27122:2131-2832(+)